MDATTERVCELLEIVGQVTRPAHSPLMLHESVVLDERGALRCEWAHQVLRAEEPGMSAMYFSQIDPEGTDGPGRLVELPMGDAAALAIDRERRILVMRVDLPVPLEPGDAVALEMTLEYPPGGARLTHHERWVIEELREHVLNVRFHPDALPVAVESVLEPKDGELTTAPVAVHGGRAQSVHLDIPARASTGLRWRFADELEQEHDPAVDGPVPAMVRAWEEFDAPGLIEC